MASAVVSKVWRNIDSQVDLIAAHPLRYLGGCARLVGLPSFVLGTHLRTNHRASDAEDAHWTRRRSPWDSLLALPFVILLCLSLVAWFLTIVPLQYFVHLVAGAPGRLFLASDRKVVVHETERRLDVREVPADAPLEPGWWDASLSGRPVAMTSMFASLLLLVVGRLLA